MQNSISVQEGKILDFVDGQQRNDTPEEYVRQTIEKRLINELKYKREQIKIEFGIKTGSSRPRADIVIWNSGDEHTQENAKIIIECKKSSINAESSKDGIEQLKSYMSVCPNCEWGMWTNSMARFVFRKIIDSEGVTDFIEYNDIPAANGKIDEIDRPKRSTLRNASDDNLLFVFRTCHNHIYANDGLHKQPAFFEFLKIIFCKIQDEKNRPNELEFYATSNERKSLDGQIKAANRIGKIFDRVKAAYSEIFDPNDKINLSPRSLAYVVSALQSYSLLNTDIDIKGKAYEEIVGANLRGDRGEFFTPRNIMKMTVEMINPGFDEKVLDSSCGTGGFIVAAMTHTLDNLQAMFEKDFGIPKDKWNSSQLREYDDRVKEIASRQYFGFDLNPDLAKATRMNMVMNNDGSGNILQVNSLLPPHMWPEEFKEHIAKALGIKASSIRNHKSIALFDVIVTNPPFGSKIPIKDEYILEQFELAHMWKRGKDSNTWEMQNKLQSSVPPEILFIERCTQLLKEGGRMGIILPDSILGSPGLGYIRQWILTNHTAAASLDLTPDTFQPNNGTQTSILILQKKTEREKTNEAIANHIANYPVFMASIDRVGHDRRGNTIYIRDEAGNEIIERNDDGMPVRTVDDQTIELPAVFEEWRGKKKTAFFWGDWNISY
ncbi:MAG: N-6 DNA methylase [Synergistaceae bacterium]|nr:N-6 DNA methylase [Synergistaceae bacterium]